MLDGGRLLMRMLLLLLVALSVGCASNATSQGNTPGIGDEGLLYDPTRTQAVIFIFNTQKSLDARDTFDAFKVAPGTKIKVIDSTYGVRQVRIIDGQFAGRTGYVPVEFTWKP